MRDWMSIVRARLSALGLEHEEQTHAELAGHLEDVYQEARRCGCSEEDADARALAQAPDWAEVARGIQDANMEGAVISQDTRTLLLPGMAAVLGDVVLFLALTKGRSPDLWADPRPSVHVAMGSLALLGYVGLGALGAGWSRYAGGSTRMRLLAGLFPLVLHLAVIVHAILIGIAAQRQRALLALVVAPGIALALGTLPFLKSTSK